MAFRAGGFRAYFIVYGFKVLSSGFGGFSGRTVGGDDLRFGVLGSLRASFRE